MKNDHYEMDELNENDIFVHLRSAKVTTWRVVRAPTARSVTFGDIVAKFLAVVKSEHPEIDGSYFEINDCMEFSIYTPSDDEVSNLGEPLIRGSEIIIDVLPMETDGDDICPPIERSKAIELKRKADKLYGEGMFSAAITLYELSGQVGFKSLIQCLYEQKQWNSLVMLHHDVLRLAPNDLDLLFIFGCAFEELGQEKATECFKTALRIADHSGIFAHFSRVFMEMEKLDLSTANIMLRRAMQFQVVNDPYLSMRWCQYFCLSGQFDKGLEMAMQDYSVMKYMTELIHKYSFVRSAFRQEIPHMKAEPQELAKVAELLYKKGCVEEALLLCQENRGSAFIGRVFLLILFNEGLYKGFAEVALSMGKSLMLNECVKELQLASAIGVFVGSLEGKLESVFPGFDISGPVLSPTERENLAIDVVGIMFVFLFCAGYPFRLDHRSNKFPISTKEPFWRMRSSCEVLRAVLPSMRDTDMRHGGTVMAFTVIGDECAIYFSYRKWLGIRLIPRIILGLSIQDLQDKGENGRKHSFWNQIEMIDQAESAGLILMLGTCDCEFGIPNLLHKGSVQDPGCAVESLVTAYAEVIQEIHTRWPEERIIVHPAIPRERTTAPIVYEFNSRLLAVLDDEYVEVIDVFRDVDPLQTVIDGLDISNYKTRLSNYFRVHS